MTYHTFTDEDGDRRCPAGQHMHKLILRTSVRNCKRCATSSRNIELFASGDDGKMTPYREPFLPHGYRPEDIERRTDCHPIAICPSCLDAFPQRGKGKVVHMDGTDFDEANPIRPNRFVLTPPPIKETKKRGQQKNGHYAPMSKDELNSYILSL